MKKFLLILLCITSLLLLLAGCSSSDKFTFTGLYLKAKNSHMIIDDYGSPIVMTAENNSGNVFDGLESGDMIKITCTAIRESYPGQCGVYSIKLTEKSTIDNIPKDTLKQLKDLGWIDNY